MNPGTKKHRSKNKYIKARPVLFNSWSTDYYSLGIFCQKANIIPDARKCLKCLRSDTEKSRLFFRGVKEAEEFTFADIAFEVASLRNLTGDRFDAVIYERAGFRILSELKEAVKDAHDWETEDQIRTGLKFVNLKNQPSMEACAQWVEGILGFADRADEAMESEGATK